MNARAFTGFVLGVSLALLLISAGVVQGSESRPADTGADPSTRLAATEESTKVCMTTSAGGMDNASYDGSFNITTWKGVEAAMAELGVQGLYVESPAQADYARIIRALLDADCDLIITVGWTMAEVTKQAANANPNQKFAIVDFAYAPGEILNNNILESTFNTRGAAFLAGYLSAGMTRRGTVSTFGAILIPPVTEAMDGYVWGIRYYNLVHNTDVQVLGWDPERQEGLFTGNFGSLDDGRAFAAALFDEGADIVFPVAGAAGLGAAAAAQERGLMAIGTDTDWYIFASEYRTVLLTSVLKKMDVAVFEAIRSVVEGNFEGGTYVGTLANDGVDLAPFHDFDNEVPLLLRAELRRVKQAIVDGKLEPGPGLGPPIEPVEIRRVFLPLLKQSCHVTTQPSLLVIGEGLLTEPRFASVGRPSAIEEISIARLSSYVSLKVKHPAPPSRC